MYRISTMSEPGLRIGGSDRLQGPLERRVKPAAGAGAGLAQGGFELGPALLNWVELGGIWGKRLQPRAPGRNGLGNPRYLVHGQVVPHDDVAPRQGLPQHLFDIGAEDCGVDRALHRHRGTQARQAQGRQQRDVLAIVVRHLVHHPHTRGSTTIKPGHGQIHAGLVDELETLCGKVQAPLLILGAQACHPWSLALTSLERLFFSGNLSRFSSRHMVLVVTCGWPACATRSHSAAKVSAGWRASSARINPSAPRKLRWRPPPWGRGAQLPVVRQRCRSFSTKGRLTANRSAISAWLSSCATKASTMRSRKS